jgi:hypothetical protein
MFDVFHEHLTAETHAHAELTRGLSILSKKEIAGAKEIVKSSNTHVAQSIALLRGLPEPDPPPFSALWSDEELMAISFPANAEPPISSATQIWDTTRRVGALALDSEVAQRTAAVVIGEL